MSLIDTVSRDIAGAMRARDAARLSALRMLKTALVNSQVEKRRELNDAESLQVVAFVVKQRRDSIEQFGKGGRQDLVDKETAELHVLETYLPPGADPAEIERIVDAAIVEAGASSGKDLGRVMKTVMPKLAGRGADGRVVNEIVRRKLGGLT